jgi:hypothetical protein
MEMKRNGTARRDLDVSNGDWLRAEICTQADAEGATVENGTEGTGEHCFLEPR